MAELLSASSFALSLKALLMTCGLRYVTLRCVTYSMTSLKCHNLLMSSAILFLTKMSGKRTYCWHKVVDFAFVQKEEKQTEIASCFACRLINRYRQCGSVENRPRTGRPPILSPRAKRVCSRMSENLEIHLCRKLQTHLIKADVIQCLNVLYDVLFARKVIKEE